MAHTGKNFVLHVKPALAEDRGQPLAALNRDRIVLVTDDDEERNSPGSERWIVIITGGEDRNPTYILRIVEDKSLNKLGAGRKANQELPVSHMISSADLIEDAEDLRLAIRLVPAATGIGDAWAYENETFRFRVGLPQIPTFQSRTA